MPLRTSPKCHPPALRARPDAPPRHEVWSSQGYLSLQTGSHLAYTLTYGACFAVGVWAMAFNHGASRVEEVRRGLEATWSVSWSVFADVS